MNLIRRALIVSFTTTTLVAQTSAPAPRSEYFPPIEPFRTGMLKVSDLHELYYELSGNPKGRPVIVLHGGPGSGSYPNLRRYHDPKKYLIVLYDQRGAGKSRPYAELRENTTQHLVEDLERLRKELNFEKVQLFGGSWGATLALAYAEQHPQKVDSLILRGVFTATRQEIDHFYHGPVGVFFPEVYNRLKAVLPNPQTPDYPRQLLELLKGDDEKKRQQAAHAWAAYETKVASIDVHDEEVEAILKDWDPFAFSLIENHYMANGCFLEEGRLLDGASRLAAIPTVIVHGRYDVICPPVTAYRLHQAIPGSRLIFVEDAGHSGGNPSMVSALVHAVKQIEEMTVKKRR